MMRSNCTRRFARSLALASVLGGCAADVMTEEQALSAPEPLAESEVQAIRKANREAEIAAGLVYTLEVEPEHEVTFFALPEGGMALGERAQLGHKLVLTEVETSSAAGIFEALRPGEEVPEVLRQLDESGAGEPGVEVEPFSADKHAYSGTVGGVTGGAHFRDAHKACPTGFGYSYAGPATHRPFKTTCLLEQSTLPAYAQYANATHSAGFVGSAVGNTRLEIYMSGTLLFNLTVLQGEIRGYILKSGNTRNCNIFGCGDWYVRSESHSYFVREVSAGSASRYHLGAGWVSASGFTRGYLYPVGYN